MKKVLSVLSQIWPLIVSLIGLVYFVAFIQSDVAEAMKANTETSVVVTATAKEVQDNAIELRDVRNLATSTAELVRRFVDRSDANRDLVISLKTDVESIKSNMQDIKGFMSDLNKARLLDEQNNHQ